MSTPAWRSAPVDLGPFDLDTVIHILVQRDGQRRMVSAAAWRDLATVSRRGSR